MGTSVLHLPSEVLGRICFFLDGVCILALLNLHHVLSMRLRSAGGLQYYVKDTIELGRRLDLLDNPSVSKFAGLLSLSVNLRDSQLSASSSSLLSLPPTLRSISMCFNFALSMWHTIPSKSGDTVQALQLNQICPGLQKLTLVGTTWIKSPVYKVVWTGEMHDLFLSNLPSTLQTLELPDEESVGMLGVPRSVTSLQLTSSLFDVGNFLAVLPHSLHTLQFSCKLQHRSMYHPVLSQDLVSFLPPFLHTLILSCATTSIFGQNEAPQWPPTLKKCKFTKFKFSSSVALFDHLPPSLTYLEVKESSKRLPKFAQIPTSTISKLPGQLETLILSSIVPLINFSDLALLPKSIRFLDVDYYPETDTEANPFLHVSPEIEHFFWVVLDPSLLHPTLIALPSTLKSLKLSINSEFNLQDLAQLPKNVTKLELLGRAVPSDLIIHTVPRSVHHFTCRSISVSGFHSRERQCSKEDELTMVESSRAAWLHRFPTCCVAEAICCVQFVPPHCTALELGPPASIQVSCLSLAPQLTALNVPMLTITTDKTFLVPPDTVKLANFSEDTSSGLVDEPIKLFTPTLTRLEITSDDPSLNCALVHFPPTLVELLAAKTLCIGPNGPFPAALEMLVLGSSWVLKPSESQELMIFPPKLTHLELKAIDNWHMTLLPATLKTLVVKELCINGLSTSAPTDAMEPSKTEYSSFSELLPRCLTSFSTQQRMALSIDDFQSIPPGLVYMSLREASVPMEALKRLPETAREFLCHTLCLGSLDWVDPLKASCNDTVTLPDEVSSTYVQTRNSLGLQLGLGDFSLQARHLVQDFNPEIIYRLPPTTVRLLVGTNTTNPVMREWEAGLFEKALPNLKSIDFSKQFISQTSISLLPAYLEILQLNGQHPHHPKTIPSLSGAIYEILPRSLHTFSIVNAPLLSPKSALLLPTGLKSLHIVAGKDVETPVGSKAIPSLPRSLTALHIPDTPLEEKDIPHLPPLLLDLISFMPNAALRRFTSTIEARDWM